MTFHPTHSEGGADHFTEDDLRSLREDAKDRRGLYGKFVVFKAEDGKTVSEPLNDVFVLRPRSDVHALEALRTYARNASYEMATRALAHDLVVWIEDIEKAADSKSSASEVKE